MKRFGMGALLLLPILFLFTGCSPVGEKDASFTIVYAVTVLLAVAMLVIYCGTIRRKDLWYILLFASILVVNIGYFSLAASSTLAEALLANRIAYLGSVLLPLSILLILWQSMGLRYARWIPLALLVVAGVVFFVAASPGYLDIYYKEVTMETVNGATVLRKEYGPWHALYLYYLLLYFAALIGSLIYGFVRKRMGSPLHAAFLVTVVLLNLGVWLIEQLVSIDLELLSISYVLCEVFLLFLNLIRQEAQPVVAPQPEAPILPTEAPAREAAVPVEPIPEAPAPVVEAAAAEPVADVSEAESAVSQAQYDLFCAGLQELTRTEKLIYQAYLDGKSTKDVLAELNIKENTLKYHNKNLYSKLYVTSRKQLVSIAQSLPQETEVDA